MKKRIVIILLIAALVLLTIRGFRAHVNGVRNEREWYVKELGFEFSGKVDTVIWPSNLLIGNIKGEIDFGKEERLREDLQYNGMLDLFLYHPNEIVELNIDSAWTYRKGDSVYINCRENVVRTYRGDKLLGQKQLIRSIRGRPF